MRYFIGAGLFAILSSIAIGICTFFGIINAAAVLHPNVTYRKVRLLVVDRPDPAEKVTVVPVYPEAGCHAPTPLKAVWSLRHQPEAWHIETLYRLESGSISIWIGNEAWGMEINGSWHYGAKCRALLWSAVSAWQVASTDKAANSLTDGEAKRAADQRESDD